jgi:hypothetical protein
MCRLPSDNGIPLKSSSRQIALGIFLLAAVAFGDYLTFWTISFAILYLLPVSIITWYSGHRTGALFCGVAAALRLAVNQSSTLSAASQLWNTGVFLGILLMFCALLDHLKQHNAQFPVLRVVARMTVIGTSAAALLGIGGLVGERLWPSDHVASASAPRAGKSIEVEPEKSADRDAMGRLAQSFDSAVRLSRPILLGSRDPNGPSCVSASLTGQVQNRVPPNPGDLDGGPGTKIETLICFDRNEVKKPSDDFNWHQGRLKTYLENELVINNSAQEAVSELSQRAAALSNALNSAASFPDGLEVVSVSDRSNWAAYCFGSLNDAIAKRDLPQARRWAAEFASSAFALEDLHSWLTFLTRNYLAALEFQSRCQTLFTAADSMMPHYDPQSTLSMYPAGIMTLNNGSNFYEVERQAELFFKLPDQRVKTLPSFGDTNSAAIWMPPAERKLFVDLENSLSPDNRKSWEQGANTAYEHTYFANMLDRIATAGGEEALATCLKRFDEQNPHATVTELMGTLMYRGHSFAGLEWADRFQPSLMDAANQLTGDDLTAFLSAAQLTNHFYHGYSNYGMTLTLRDAMTQGKLDCVRATDMIGTVFRDSGRTKFGHVRWCAETAGHSVAAYLGAENQQPKTFLVDGLNPSASLESWPDAYFKGHAWPAGMEANPTPYCMELYVRGLDNYVWAEGYIVRGPNAGHLTKATIPYLPLRQRNETSLIFKGPYPN